MKPTIVLPPQDFLQECFSYNEETGELIWKIRPRHHFRKEEKWRQFNKWSAGKPAGIIVWRDRAADDANSLRVKFQYEGRRMFPAVHRLIFALKGITVSDESVIDHRDGNPRNNRWDNLRLATSSQNSCNKRRHKKGKQDLPKGVSTYGRLGKYRIACMVNGRSIQKYGFLTPEAAFAEYCRLSQELHGSFHRAS